MATTTAHLSIIVEKGTPVDWQRFRHTAIYIRFANQSPSALVQITGPPGDYRYDPKSNYDPSTNQDLARIIDVGVVQAHVKPAQFLAAFSTVPIVNGDPEYNCQTWVEQALKMLQIRDLLTSESYGKALEGMVDAIAEAEDEEE